MTQGCLDAPFYFLLPGIACCDGGPQNWCIGQIAAYKTQKGCGVLFFIIFSFDAGAVIRRSGHVFLPLLRLSRLLRPYGGVRHVNIQYIHATVNSPG